MEPADPAGKCARAEDWLKTGRISEATALLHKALLEGPQDPQILHRIGTGLLAAGDFETATGCFSKASLIQPENPTHRLMLADAFARWHRLPEAERIFGEFIDTGARPEVEQRAMFSLAMACIENAQPKKALSLCKVALERFRDARFAFLSEHANLQCGDYGRAIEDMRMAIHIGDANLRKRAVVSAAKAFRHAKRYSEYLDLLLAEPDLESDPTLLNLATEFYNVTGRLEAEITLNRKLLQIDPDDPCLYSRQLKKLTASDKVDERQIFEFSREWDRKFGTPSDRPAFTSWLTHADNGRKRLGILSKTFHRHVTQTILLALLPELARHFELYAYSDGERRDAFTEELQKSFTVWRDTHALAEAEAARVIHEDALDALIDISGHFNDARTRILTYRPAPVQIHYADSSSSLGIMAVQYRFSDAVAEPLERGDPYSTEKVLRLPHGFFLYKPFYDLPPAGPCPSGENGYVTFGSCASLHKITDTTLALWKRALDAVPGSRFVLARDEFSNDPGTRDYWSRRFVEAGITGDRFSILSAEKEDFVRLRFYNRIDIVLDTFPYSGVTTTMDAMWMGVPVVNYRETRFINRVCSSLLLRVGLEDLVAETQEDFARIAAGLAADAGRRSRLRKTLRTTMQSSPLCDAGAMANDMATAINGVLK